MTANDCAYLTLGAELVPCDAQKPTTPGRGDESQPNHAYNGEFRHSCASCNFLVSGCQPPDSSSEIRELTPTPAIILVAREKIRNAFYVESVGSVDDKGSDV